MSVSGAVEVMLCPHWYHTQVFPSNRHLPLNLYDKPTKFWDLKPNSAHSILVGGQLMREVFIQVNYSLTMFKWDQIRLMNFPSTGGSAYKGGRFIREVLQ